MSAATDMRGTRPDVRGVVRPLSIAPMMERTDRHFRVMIRLLTRHTLLYTEMITTGAVIHGDRERILAFDPREKPLALQLGGDDPAALAECARIAEAMGYDEVNLNVGCPSSRVRNGAFGACLMARPERVAEAVSAMRGAASVPVTVKHRIGIDDLDSYEDMARFVRIVSEAGCDRFSVHARKAWLNGLSPKDNRTIPPLRYEDVHRLKREYPALVVEINGGFGDLDAVEGQLGAVDAVMIGRAAWDDPWMFVEADRRFFGDDGPRPSRHEVVGGMAEYARAWLERPDTRLHHVSRHVLNLFHGCHGGRAFRRHLSENAWRPESTADLLLDALDRVPDPGA